MSLKLPSQLEVSLMQHLTPYCFRVMLIQKSQLRKDSLGVTTPLFFQAKSVNNRNTAVLIQSFHWFLFLPGQCSQQGVNHNLLFIYVSYIYVNIWYHTLYTQRVCYHSCTLPLTASRHTPPHFMASFHLLFCSFFISLNNITHILLRSIQLSHQVIHIYRSFLTIVMCNETLRKNSNSRKWLKQRHKKLHFENKIQQLKLPKLNGSDHVWLI